MQQLEIEDCNVHHKSLSQLDSSTSVNFAAYDHRQNKGKSNKKNRGNGKDQAQNKSGEQGSSNSGHQSRKPPGMEGKCMRCGKHEHLPGQRCPAKNAKCKDCHKIGHFHKVCQSKKRATQRANLVQSPQDDDDIPSVFELYFFREICKDKNIYLFWRDPSTVNPSSASFTVALQLSILLLS